VKPITYNVYLWIEIASTTRLHTVRQIRRCGSTTRAQLPEIWHVSEQSDTLFLLGENNDYEKFREGRYKVLLEVKSVKDFGERWEDVVWFGAKGAAACAKRLM
jgi:hypothetical protein